MDTPKKPKGRLKLRANIIASDILPPTVGTQVTFTLSPNPDMRNVVGKYAQRIPIELTMVREVSATFADAGSHHWEIEGTLLDDYYVVHGGQVLDLKRGERVRGEQFAHAQEPDEGEQEAPAPSIHGWLLGEQAAAEIIATNAISNNRADRWWANQCRREEPT